MALIRSLFRNLVTIRPSNTNKMPRSALFLLDLSANSMQTLNSWASLSTNYSNCSSPFPNPKPVPSPPNRNHPQRNHERTHHSNRLRPLYGGHVVCSRHPLVVPPLFLERRQGETLVFSNHGGPATIRRPETNGLRCTTRRPPKPRQPHSQRLRHLHHPPPPSMRSIPAC
jgi:hypothetical protein